MTRRMFPVGSVVALAVALTVPSSAATRVWTSDEPAVVTVGFVNGHGPFRFVIDTGATATLLDESVARAAGLEARGIVPVTTVAGVWNLQAGLVDELVVEGRRFSHLDVNWAPLDGLRDAAGRAADGIVGQDVLGRAAVTIDYRLGELRIDPGGACAEGDVTAPVTWANGLPMIEAQVLGAGDRAAARLVLDSGADALWLYAAAIDGADARAVSHNGSIAARRLPLARAVVGGILLRGPAAEIASDPRIEDGLLPTAWFSRVCIDGPRAVAVLDGR